MFSSALFINFPEPILKNEYPAVVETVLLFIFKILLFVSGPEVIPITSYDTVLLFIFMILSFVIEQLPPVHITLYLHTLFIALNIPLFVIEPC